MYLREGEICVSPSHQNNDANPLDCVCGCVCPSVNVSGWPTGEETEHSVRETAVRTNSVSGQRQVDVWALCHGYQPPHQSHFPKLIVTHVCPRPPGLCYSTSQRDNGLIIGIWCLRLNQANLTCASLFLFGWFDRCLPSSGGSLGGKGA